MKILSKGLSVLLVFILLGLNSIQSLAIEDVNLDKDTKKQLTFDQKIGVNGFVDNHFENFQVAGTLREYHNFGWTYDKDSKSCYFQSSWFDFDKFYEKVHNAGIEILPCIQQGDNPENREYKPASDMNDTENPMSYKVHSNVMFNYAARYGHTKVDASRLNLTSKTEAKSGLGYITYYENWNEPDKTWIGKKACFSPEEFAAMCSADYDGHEGMLGKNYGIKQADPNAKLVYGGLAGGEAGVQYLERMKAWSEKNRPSKTLPFDAINFHMYCITDSPENSKFREAAQALIDWRDKNAPELEIWITEFGWDTNPDSPRTAGTYNKQRDWLIREYLMADRLGLDRAIAYTLRDDASSSSKTQYMTCGLTTQKGSEQRKPSWYGVNTAKNALAGYRFSKAIKEDSEMYVYKYVNDNNDECYVLWLPSNDDARPVEYKIIQSDMESVSVTNIVNSSELGITNTIEASTESSVTIPVGTTPVFVKINKKENETTPVEDTNKEQEDNKEDLDNEDQKIEEPKQEETKPEEKELQRFDQKKIEVRIPNLINNINVEKQETPEVNKPEEVKQEETKPEQKPIAEEPKQDIPKVEEPKQEQEAKQVEKFDLVIPKREIKNITNNTENKAIEKEVKDSTEAKIVKVKNINSDVKKEEPKYLPKTGDNSYLLFIAIGVLAVLGSYSFIGYRRIIKQEKEMFRVYNK